MLPVIPIGFDFDTNETRSLPGVAQTIVSFLYPIGIRGLLVEKMACGLHEKLVKGNLSTFLVL